MDPKFEKLKQLLEELFLLDQPTLDFGLYRIMHAKSEEITRFLEHDLLSQIKSTLSDYGEIDKQDLKLELNRLISSIKEAGMNPEHSPKVKELNTQLETDAALIRNIESDVYEHLYGFFRRYYLKGDFLAKRVYKRGVYAIPYEGEEVAMHWASKDQYYIKTNEYLRDYAFCLKPNDEKDPMRVRFRLVNVVEGEHGNIQTTNGSRVFILAKGLSDHKYLVEEEGEQGKELIISFEYRPAILTDWPESEGVAKKNPPKQKDLNVYANKCILGGGRLQGMDFKFKKTAYKCKRRGFEIQLPRSTFDSIYISQHF